MRRLVVATHNQKKGQEMREILVARFPDLELLTLDDYPGIEEPEETGTTYAENAVLKAEAAAAATGEACVADDAGLEIDFLNGKPGLQSKRFLGEKTPFEVKIAAILEQMAGVPDDKRSARFRVAVALARPDQPVHSFAAACEGRIAFESRGTGGFGYDSIFFLPDLGCTMAELTPEQKNAVSHRGKVLKMLGDYIQAHAAIVQSH